MAAMVFGSAGRAALSRRSMLAGMAAGGIGVAAWPLVRAAGAAALGNVSDIARFIGPIDQKFAAKGIECDLGVMLAVTGPGSSETPRVLDAIKLAVKQIELLGGPRFNLIVKDNKSGDPQAGVEAVRELGFAKVPALLSSYVADLGAGLPGIAQYKMFTLDGAGGTSLFAQGKPYFWGPVAITPDDALPGAARYIHEHLPQVKRISTVGWGLGPLIQTVMADNKKSFESAGITVGTFENVKIGLTDYSASLAKIRADKPDMISLPVFGNDVGVFLKQYATSGIGKPVLAYAHTAGATEIAGPAYENLYLAFDYFDAARPANGWAKIFVDEFRSAYNMEPNNYAANYYEETFAMWDVIRRVLSAGGDPKDGEQLDKAFRAKPSFASVYAGSADKAGIVECDLKTHSVKRRPMAIAQYRNKQVVPLAFYNVGGADFRLA
jgi:branched-chain amino acid transport system substrate-binding protein